MKFEDFEIGKPFWTVLDKWTCIYKAHHFIIAIRDGSCQQTPFDEGAIATCSKTPCTDDQQEYPAGLFRKSILELVRETSAEERGKLAAKLYNDIVNHYEYVGGVK